MDRSQADNLQTETPYQNQKMTTRFQDLQVLKRWAEHFKNVLNRPSEINQEAIHRLPQIPLNHLIAETHTPAETKKATLQLSDGKAPGSDAIPAELYKGGGPALIKKLTELFRCIWESE